MYLDIRNWVNIEPRFIVDIFDQSMFRNVEMDVTRYKRPLGNVLKSSCRLHLLRIYIDTKYFPLTFHNVRNLLLIFGYMKLKTISLLQTQMFQI